MIESDWNPSKYPKIELLYTPYNFPGKTDSSGSPMLLGFPTKSNAAATKWHSSKAAKLSMASRIGQILFTVVRLDIFLH